MQKYLTLKNPGILNTCLFHEDPRRFFQFYLINANSHYCLSLISLPLNTICVTFIISWIFLYIGDWKIIQYDFLHVLLRLRHSGQEWCWVNSVRPGSGFAAQETSLLTDLNRYSVSSANLSSLSSLKGPYPGQFELTVIFLHI